MHVQFSQGGSEGGQAAWARAKTPPASRPDEDNPEWILDGMCAARRALTVIAEVPGADIANALRRGRPRKQTPKVNQTLRLDADVLEAIRREGPGWQTRINAILRAHKPG
jgi:uncharacterized protein (DUF4415 family)